MKWESGWFFAIFLLCSLSFILLTETQAAQEAYSLPQALVGVPYEFPITIAGGLPPLEWRVAEGELPPGIQLLASGVIRGTPNTPRREPFYFTIEVSDSSQPPQRYTERFSIAVSAARLKILLPSSKEPDLAINHDRTAISSNRLSKMEAVPGGETATFIPAPQLSAINTADRKSAMPHWVLPVTLTGDAGLAKEPESSLATSQNASAPPAKPPGSAAGGEFNFRPSTFIYIYEDTPGGKRIQVYDPTKSQNQSGIQLSADYQSTLVIIPDPKLMGDDLPLNNLYISAVLSSEDKNQNVEVKGYSEVGTDKATMGSQRGMAFQTTRNVTNMIINMAYTTFDIMRDVSNLDPKRSLYEQEDQIQKTIDEMRKPGSGNADAIQRAKDRLSLYKPEIQTISAFFADPHNISVVQVLGKEIFWIDADSLKEIAKQYLDNARIAFDSNSTADAQKQAVIQLIERTHLVVEDFHDLIIEAHVNAQSTDCVNKIDKQFQGGTLSADAKKSMLEFCGVEELAFDRHKHAFDALKRLFAAGNISLRSAKAADGNLLTLTITAVGSEGGTVGIPAVFEVSLKKYGAKIQWSPSLLFVRRLGVTDAEVTPPAGSTASPLNRINFAPSPGMTFGIAYFKRGQSSGDKFIRALGPGLGMNVTFMNFNDPSFDLATGKFVNTTGTNVQVGAGTIGSLFDNKIQLSYGWNLNVERRRSYFGVGFGFIEIGKELAKYVGK